MSSMSKEDIEMYENDAKNKFSNCPIFQMVVHSNLTIITTLQP